MPSTDKIYLFTKNSQHTLWSVWCTLNLYTYSSHTSWILYPSSPLLLSHMRSARSSNCVFQLEQATFQAVSGHMRLVATLLDSESLGNLFLASRYVQDSNVSSRHMEPLFTYFLSPSNLHDIIVTEIIKLANTSRSTFYEPTAVLGTFKCYFN